MRYLRILLLAAYLLLSHAARADSFTFQFSGISDSGSGTLTAIADGTNGQYLATDIVGTVNGLTIASLLAPGTYPSDVPNDNSFFFPATPDTSYFDDCGISFELSDGTDINIYYGTYAGGGAILGPGYILVEGDAESPDALNSLTVSAAVSPSAITPEPTTFTLLAIGLVSSVTLPVRLRKRKLTKH